MHTEKLAHLRTWGVAGGEHRLRSGRDIYCTVQLAEGGSSFKLHIYYAFGDNWLELISFLRIFIRRHISTFFMRLLKLSKIFILSWRISFRHQIGFWRIFIRAHKNEIGFFHLNDWIENKIHDILKNSALTTPLSAKFIKKNKTLFSFKLHICYAFGDNWLELSIF